MKKIIVFLLLAIIVLSACAPVITSGTVVDKIYEPERRWVQLMPIMINKTTTYIPITYHDDEDWILTIADAEGNKRSIKVDVSTFEKVEIGSFFTIEDNNTLTDKDEKTR